VDDALGICSAELDQCDARSDVKVGLPRWSLTTEIRGEWRPASESWRESICLVAEEPGSAGDADFGKNFLQAFSARALLSP